MSVHLYPVQNTGMPRVGYRVRVNGREAPTDGARVSAVPYNRRWPGRQRTPDQTEGAEFLSLYANEPLTVEVTLPRPSECVTVRPRSLGIVPERLSPTAVRFTLPKPVYCTVEPYGRREALHLFPDAEEYAAPKGGGTVRSVLRPGRSRRRADRADRRADVVSRRGRGRLRVRCGEGRLAYRHPRRGDPR